MKRITDFIVKGRYFFLMLFVVLAVFSLFLAKKVNINDDIMKYLPASSEVKIGKDIMDKEFAEEDSSILNVMFKDLTNTEKEDTLKKLENIPGVSSVNYENNEQYNKNKYTLYVLNVDDYANSNTASNVYDYVKTNFKTAGLSGSIYNENKPILQLSIVVLAISSAMVILIILSDSYIEPFLYLISIGIAVFINKGTNIIFPSVSAITNSIVAILQLALSMDYSIMLSNRYKQEKKTNSNKIEAMKEALYHSFLSISSSSITTIVGLVALVFMSFTIGKDLGFVLAKGVLLSLISIFFCLPALLLIFDNLISKTHKKAPKFNLTKLGNFSFKTRYLQVGLILGLFILAYILKGNVNILYTDAIQDKVGKVFPATNQIAIVYNNKYEDLIANYCKNLEGSKNIDQVLCYSNTINEPLPYAALNRKFQDLGVDTTIDDYLIKLVYYNYYQKDVSNKITLNELVNFIKTDIYTNANFSTKINQNIKDNIDLLENFVTPNLINKKRAVNEIANLLGMSENDVQNILIYYNSKNSTIKLSIKDFVNFILNDVAGSKYGNGLDNVTIAKLKKLESFTDITQINKKMEASELADILGIDEQLIEQLFLFYHINTLSTTKMTLNEFANWTLELTKQDSYKNLIDEETLQSLLLLENLSNETIINKEMPPSLMAETLNSLGMNIDTETLNLLYIYYTGIKTDNTLTLNEFAHAILKLSENEYSASLITEDIKEELETIITLSEYYNQELPSQNLYKMFGLNEEIAKMLNYAITQNENGTYKMTPLAFVNTLLNSNIAFGDKLKDLQMAQYIMNNVTKAYKAKEMANALSLNEAMVQFGYGFVASQNNELNNISLKELINLIVNNKDNPLFSTNISSSLDQAYFIVNNTSSKFNYEEISNITKTDATLINQIFGIYDYNNYPTLLTPLELVNLIINNENNDIFKDKISSVVFNELYLVKEVMEGTINNKKYNANEISSLLNIDNETLKLLFGLYDTKYNSKTISLKNYVNFIVKDVMNDKAYQNSFNAENKEKLTAINNLMTNALTKYTSFESFTLLNKLSSDIDKSLIDLVYMYYGSTKEYDNSWQMTIEEFVNFLNTDILPDERFNDFIDTDKRKTIMDAKDMVAKSKKLIVSDKYSRTVLNTKYDFEGEETYEFVNSIKSEVGNNEDIYIVGNSLMAEEMSKTFNAELNKITILTMIFIFVVVAISFKDLIIPVVLILIIETAVYTTMSAISVAGGSVYFIALLIVQAILMGATIDYAIVYTSYYLEARHTMGVKASVVNAYNKSINTIISSSSILIIVTLVVAGFASAIAAKICETISQGTFASLILILFLLPGVLAAFDKIICRKGYYKEK